MDNRVVTLMRDMSRGLRIACLVACSVAPSGLCQVKDSLRGIVILPSGVPIQGATVTIRTECSGSGFTLSKETTTAPDGTFAVPIFGNDCQHYRFSASKKGDFWLETGEAVFYGGPNGASPILDSSSANAFNPVTIKLGVQGGRVDFQVWDSSAGRFIYSLLEIERRPIDHKKYGSMEIATGKDGSADTLLLPPGEYSASVVMYQCGDKQYSAVVYPTLYFSVIPNANQKVKITIDVRTIKNSKTYANPGGEKCES